MNFVSIAALLAAILAQPALAAPSPSPTPRVFPRLLEEVREKYRQAVTLQANFTQVNESAALRTKKTSSGVLLIKQPDKVRWETLKPDRNLLVSDGKKFWFYTPPFDEGENGQVIERKSSKVKSQMASALLSGTFDDAGKIRVRKQADNRFLLVPRSGNGGTVKEAVVEIDAEKKLITKVTLLHRDGNRAEITLDKIELGKKLDEEYFHFEAPPKTDRVTE